MAFPVAANPDMPNPRRSPVVGQSPYPDAQLNDPGFTGVLSADGTVPCVIEAPANRAVRVQLFEPSMHQEQPENILEEFNMDAGERITREVPSPNTSYRFLDRRIDNDPEAPSTGPNLPETEAEANAGAERVAAYEAAEDERQRVEDETAAARDKEQQKRNDARQKEAQAQAKEREQHDRAQEQERAQRAKSAAERQKAQGQQEPHGKRKE